MNTPKARSTMVLLALAFALESAAVVASSTSTDIETPPPVSQEKKWYEEKVPTAADFDAQAAEKRRRKHTSVQEHDARPAASSRSIDRL